MRCEAIAKDCPSGGVRSTRGGGDIIQLVIKTARIRNDKKRNTGKFF